MNSASTATKISGKPSNLYWVYQGPYGKLGNLASTMFLKSVVGPNGQINGLTENYNASNSGFSINGPHALTGSVGRTMSMSKSNTPFRGVHAKGNGGKGGRYPDGYNDRIQFCRQGIITPQVASSYVRPSVLSNKGMLARKYKWINNGQYPNNWVQPVYTGNQTDTASQGVYLQKKSAANYCWYDVNNTETYVDYFKSYGPTGCQTTPARGYTIGIQQANAPYTKTLHIPKSASDYTLRVQQQCQNPSGRQKPFPYAVQTGTGVLRGGISVNNVANACNTSNIELTPPAWYTATPVGKEDKEAIAKVTPKQQAQVFVDMVLNGTTGGR
jgi:hypothetical protein